jgi:hypothetical protein
MNFERAAVSLSQKFLILSRCARDISLNTGPFTSGVSARTQYILVRDCVISGLRRSVNEIFALLV